MTERDLIRRLEKTPVPPPPEDLAARIINDIPAEVELHPEFEHEEHRRRFHRRPVWMAAAAAVTIALTGAVTWELRYERPQVEMIGAENHRREIFEQIDEAEEIVAGRLVVADTVDGGKINLEAAADPDRESSHRPTSEGDVQQGKRKAIQEKNGAVIRRVPIPDPAPATEGRRRQTQETSPSAMGKTDDNIWGALKAQGEMTESASVEPSTEIAQDQVEPNSPETEGESATNLVIVMKPAAFADQIIVAESPKVDTRRPSAMAGEATVSRESRLEESPLAYEIQRNDSGVARDKLANKQAPPAQKFADYFIAGTVVAPPAPPELKKSKVEGVVALPSTGGTAEPNDKPYGDVFFEHTGVNPFVDSEDDRLSTFGLDVDTGSFTVARRYLRDGNLPPRAAIRIEEFVNFFDYGDAPPRRSDFRLIVEGAPSVFAAGDRTYTLRLAVKAREVDAADRPPAVLVFCIDVSGSMNRENRLGLVKKALFELLENLRRDDHVGLVVYGSSGRVLLKPTTDHDEIRRAIDRLQAGGATNAEQGLVLAYDLLRDGDDDGRLRRVILCSDGVANVGRTGPDSILERIRREASGGIELTTVGFGMGNYNDTLMEQLADSGNGRYAYVDGLSEARRIFVEELTGTLLTLGHDAKAQVEFDPDVVSRWRLLGYENRDIADHLFRDPTVDAGEIGAGHTVTAIYEVKLRPKVGRRDRVATLRLRYRPMGETREIELDETLRVSHLAKSWEDASPALKLASSVAEFAEILKGAYWARDGDLDDVQRRVRLLEDGKVEDKERLDTLVEMVSTARGLRRR
jgi:Ca-activated chloride channel family protein